MNAERLNETIERAVGPVRSSLKRKDRMREELAAHLTASWEEERNRDGDDAAATERAIKRLGDLDELSVELQRSVPWLERRLFTPVAFLKWLDALDLAMRRRDSETPLRYAVRIMIWMTLTIAAIEIVALPIAAAIRSRPQTGGPIWVWFFATLAGIALGSLIFPLLCEATIRAIEDGNGWGVRTAICLTLSSVAVVALGLGFALIVSLAGPPGFSFDPSNLPRLVAGSLFAPPLVGFAARESISRRRRRLGWATNARIPG